MTSVLAAVDAKFRESEHPRVAGGKHGGEFTSTGGSGEIKLTDAELQAALAHNADSTKLSASQRKLLNGVVRRSVLKKPMTLWRGIDGMETPGFKSLDVGKTFTFRSIESASADRAVAHAFTDMAEYPALFKLELPKGYHAFDMNNIEGGRSWEDEAEWILEAGAKFEVVAIDRVKTEYSQDLIITLKPAKDVKTDSDEDVRFWGSRAPRRKAVKLDSSASVLAAVNAAVESALSSPAVILDAAFNEADHPRGPDGKFTGASGTSPYEGQAGKFKRVGSANLAKQGFKPKKRAAGNSMTEVAQVAWTWAQHTGKPQAFAAGQYGRGYTLVKEGQKLPYGHPHIVVWPDGTVESYQADFGAKTDSMNASVIRAAGILFITPERKVLFLKRGPGGDYPGAWCFPGGTSEGSETPEETAVREAGEECGSFPKGKRSVLTRSISPVITAPGSSVAGSTEGALTEAPSVDYTTFLQRVEEEFTPKVNGEHTGYAWAQIDLPPEPLHPGCRIALNRMTMDELGVARAMMEGSLTSPQKYGNVTLFDMRITGTGVAFRNEKKDDKGNVIQKEEFVYRRPENYLTPDFLARCNGLQVIMMHPKTAILTSKEFSARTVGAMMLPYIKGDEVWGIAKLYDDEAIRLLESETMSTSPAVLLGNGDQKVTFEGKDLLIEGAPSLLDHLAICEHGVWDKGGEPSGIRQDSKTGATKMTPEEINKLIKDAIAAAIPAAVTAAIESARADSEAQAKARLDADGGTIPDKLLKGLDAITEKVDAMSKRMDAMEAKKHDDDDSHRADSLKMFSHRKDDDDDDSYSKRHDAEEKACADAMCEKGMPKETAADKAKKYRKDAEEMMAADKRKKDDDNAKKKADAARTDSTEIPALKAQIADLSRQIPKPLSDEDRHLFATHQAKADDVFSAFGKRAPFPLTGEDVLAYRKRLINGLKEHSPRWKDVDVIKLDAATFANVERDVLHEALSAAMRPADLKEGELRPLIKVDSHTGLRRTEFVGPNSFIAGLKRPPRYVTHIGARKEH